MLPNVPSAGQFKRCTSCGEVIREDASVCRFCHRELPLAHEG
jgi:RNA polymerase subunit RPABC4/transcription elongation factor Spt4